MLTIKDPIPTRGGGLALQKPFVSQSDQPISRVSQLLSFSGYVRLAACIFPQSCLSRGLEFDLILNRARPTNTWSPDLFVCVFKRYLIVYKPKGFVPEFKTLKSLNLAIKPRCLGLTKINPSVAFLQSLALLFLYSSPLKLSKCSKRKSYTCLVWPAEISVVTTPMFTLSWPTFAVCFLLV